MQLSYHAIATLALLAVLALDLPGRANPASLFADGPPVSKPFTTRASRAFTTALARGSSGVQQTLREHRDRALKSAVQRLEDQRAQIERARLLTKATTLLAHGLVIQGDADEGPDVAENERALMAGQGPGVTDAGFKEDDEKQHVVALLSASLHANEDKGEDSAELLLDFTEPTGLGDGEEGRRARVADASGHHGRNHSGAGNSTRSHHGQRGRQHRHGHDGPAHAHGSGDGEQEPNAVVDNDDGASSDQAARSTEGGVAAPGRTSGDVDGDAESGGHGLHGDEEEGEGEGGEGSEGDEGGRDGEGSPGDDLENSFDRRWARLSELDFIDDVSDEELDAYLSGFVTIEFPGASPLDVSEDFLDGLPHETRDRDASSVYVAPPEHGAREEGVTANRGADASTANGGVEGEAAEAVASFGAGPLTPEEHEEAEMELVYTGIL